MSHQIRSSLASVLARAPAEPLWKLKLDAVERGLCVIDLGQVKSRDFLFGRWAKDEAVRQANDEKRRR